MKKLLLIIPLILILAGCGYEKSEIYQEDSNIPIIEDGEPTWEDNTTIPKASPSSTISFKPIIPTHSQTCIKYYIADDLNASSTIYHFIKEDCDYIKRIK